MKAIYNQPTTEVMYLKAEETMQSALVVSPGTPPDPTSPPGAHAPARGEIIP